MHPGTNLGAIASAATSALLHNFNRDDLTLSSRVSRKGVDARTAQHSGLRSVASTSEQNPNTRSMDELPSTASEDERRLVALMIAYQSGDLAAFEQLYGLLIDEVQRHFTRVH